MDVVFWASTPSASAYSSSSSSTPSASVGAKSTSTYGVGQRGAIGCISHTPHRGLGWG